MDIHYILEMNLEQIVNVLNVKVENVKSLWLEKIQNHIKTIMS